MSQELKYKTLNALFRKNPDAIQGGGQPNFDIYGYHSYDSIGSVKRTLEIVISEVQDIEKTLMALRHRLVMLEQSRQPSEASESESEIALLPSTTQSLPSMQSTITVGTNPSNPMGSWYEEYEEDY